MNTRVCTKCGRELPLTRFDRDSRPNRGHYSSCKECKARYRRENRKRLLIAQYARRVGNQALSPQREAWNALYHALQTGGVVKPSVCSICGAGVGVDKIQGHHYDYSKPFDVVWCCQDCHAQLDRKRREVAV